MKPDYFLIHGSGTVDSETLSWSAIRRYHVFDKGWRAIGTKDLLDDENKDSLVCIFGLFYVFRLLWHCITSLGEKILHSFAIVFCFPYRRVLFFPLTKGCQFRCGVVSRLYDVWILFLKAIGLNAAPLHNDAHKHRFCLFVSCCNRFSLMKLHLSNDCVEHRSWKQIHNFLNRIWQYLFDSCKLEKGYYIAHKFLIFS